MKFAYLIEPPFNYRTVSGNTRGHDIDLARYVFAQLGERFESVETEFARLIPGLATGEWRMTTGLFATEGRRKSAIFTRPIWALPDGLLVKSGNPLSLSGYLSVAGHGTAVLAVIRDQVQHRTALKYNVPLNRIRIFETYGEAAAAVRDGTVDAYASVGRAHAGFIAENPGWALENLEVPHGEKAPAFGCFALALSDGAFCARVDAILADYLRSQDYLHMAKGYGFTDEDVKRVANSRCGPTAAD